MARRNPVTRVIAHRGLHAEVRENTVAAFEAALAAGVDGVELDVRSTRDGLLVVHHDPIVDGQVISETLGADLPTHVASLGEAILACGDLEVNVELKMDAYGLDDERRTPFIDRVLAQVISLGAASRVTYSSFDASACAALVERQTESLVGLLLDWDEDVEAAIELAVGMRCRALHPYFATVNEQVISAASETGLAINVWTPNARDDLSRMIGAGVDAVITDDPVLAIELRGL